MEDVIEKRKKTQRNWNKRHQHDEVFFWMEKDTSSAINIVLGCCVGSASKARQTPGVTTGRSEKVPNKKKKNRHEGTSATRAGEEHDIAHNWQLLAGRSSAQNEKKQQQPNPKKPNKQMKSRGKINKNEWVTGHILLCQFFIERHRSGCIEHRKSFHTLLRRTQGDKSSMK